MEETEDGCKTEKNKVLNKTENEPEWQLETTVVQDECLMMIEQKMLNQYFI